MNKVQHLVVCADTKAVNGHSDVLFGHVATRQARLLDAVRDWRRIAGAIPGPFEAWLVHRGIETLELRFARMSDSALALAQRLRGTARCARSSIPACRSTRRTNWRGGRCAASARSSA